MRSARRGMCLRFLSADSATKIMADSKEAIQKVVDQWLDNSNSICIVVFGKIGAGKSSLINTLFKEKLAKEGSTLYSETKVVKRYTKSHRITVTFRQIQYEVNGVRVTVWDTPGLKDPFATRDHNEMLKGIGEECDIHNEVDLLVYCMSFKQIRLEEGEVDCIRDITEVFGGEIWNKAVFALTYANQAEPSIIKSRGEEWKEIIYRAMKEKVPAAMEGDKIIPVIPTGYGEEHQPEGWFTNFWTACLSQVIFYNIPALIMSTRDQVQVKVEPDVTAKVIGQRIVKLGGGVQQELDAARQIDTDSGSGGQVRTQPSVVASPQIWSGILIETIQQRFQKLKLGDVGTQSHVAEPVPAQPKTE